MLEDAFPKGLIIYNNLVISLTTYNALGLGN